MNLSPGDSFGEFRLLKELGRGATGTVFLAEQTNLGRECALKVLAPELVRDQAFLDRFRREGKIAASLRHKSIVRIFDLVICDKGLALAMDYIEGQELQQYLNAQRVPQDVAVEITVNVLDALEYAHGKGVVHRDIKPANILMETDGSIFLTDFSIARMAGGEKLTRTGTVIGTPEYMAPEQFDAKEIDGRADLYATALILYEMLAGKNPFGGESLAETVKKQILVEPPTLTEIVSLPKELSDVVARGLKKNPDDRFQSAKEMKEALQKVGRQSPNPGSLTQFLSSVELGAISMDDAVNASQKVKEAIDKGFKRNLTIVMLDLAGSSKIKIPNQTLIADRAFQDYRGTINRILEAHNCERYDWSGDGAISLFANPVEAVDAAVAVQRSVSTVGERHQSLPDALKVRIGIRTGLVYYDPRRTLGEFASRTVDQAGHLEKDCPPGAIRLGDTTVAAIGNRYKTVSKGINRDDIEVFEIELEELHGMPPTPSPVPAQSEVASPPPDVPTTESEVRYTTNELPPAPQPRVPEPVVSAASTPAAPPLPPVRTPVVSEVKSPPPVSEPVIYSPPQELVPVSKQELFRPKNEKASLTQRIEAAGPWWGWRTLGLLAFLWAGVLSINRYLPSLAVPHQATGSFTLLFGLHLVLVPFYCLYCLVTGQADRAKEAAGAGLLFFLGSAGFVYHLLTN